MVWVGVWVVQESHLPPRGVYVVYCMCTVYVLCVCAYCMCNMSGVCVLCVYCVWCV